MSGDGDFCCLAKYLEENNKLFKIGIPNYYKYSCLLKRFSEYFFYINNLRDKLGYKKERH
ncbi:hypothetical protein HZA39_02940 [Candidatus Peregrinibacteria bacterium]|nr:hypothetical protein [Candidatus Peregrinibacteria bacterium]